MNPTSFWPNSNLWITNSVMSYQDEAITILQQARLLALAFGLVLVWHDWVGHPEVGIRPETRRIHRVGQLVLMEGDLISQGTGIVVRGWSSHLDTNSVSYDTWRHLMAWSERGRLDHHVSQMAASVCRMLQTQSQPSLIGNSLNSGSVSLTITFYVSHFQRFYLVVTSTPVRLN